MRKIKKSDKPKKVNFSGWLSRRKTANLLIEHWGWSDDFRLNYITLCSSIPAEGKFRFVGAIRTWLSPTLFVEIANFLKDSVNIDGVSLDELNLMLELAKGLETGSSDDLKNKLKGLLASGPLSSAKDICARLQQVFDSGDLSKSGLAKTLLVQKVTELTESKNCL